MLVVAKNVKRNYTFNKKPPYILQEKENTEKYREM
jgi:hypothetical protein